QRSAGDSGGPRLRVPRARICRIRRDVRQARSSDKGKCVAMRLARRAPVLVALSLLTSAARAYAECAWVLWEDRTQLPQSKPTSTEPVRAYTTRQDCDRALSGALAEFQSSSAQTVLKDEKHQEAVVTTLGKITISY